MVYNGAGQVRGREARGRGRVGRRTTAAKPREGSDAGWEEISNAAPRPDPAHQARSDHLHAAGQQYVTRVRWPRELPAQTAFPKDGQILISQRVAARLNDNIALEDMGALTLKGLTQPVVAFNVPLAASQPALRVIEGGPQSV